MLTSRTSAQFSSQNSSPNTKDLSKSQDFDYTRYNDVNVFCIFWNTNHTSARTALRYISDTYALKQPIRQTSSALLFYATKTSDSAPVVLKFVTNKQVAHCEINILDEAMLITGRNHIVNCIEHFPLSVVNCHVFVLEYLRDDPFRPTTAMELVKFMNDIADALLVIHLNVVIYADMKPEHILFNHRTKEATLIDFGLSFSARANKNVRAIYGTVPYLAPEILEGEPLTSKVDIWGFGLSLVEILLESGTLFKNTTDNLLSEQKSFVHRIEEVRVTIEHKLPRIVTDCIWNLIKRMLSLNPQERPRSKDIYDITAQLLSK